MPTQTTQPDPTRIWTDRTRPPQPIRLHIRGAQRDASEGPLSRFRAYFGEGVPSESTMRIEHAALCLELPFALEMLVRQDSENRDGRARIGTATVLMDMVLRSAQDEPLKKLLHAMPLNCPYEDWQEARGIILAIVHSMIRHIVSTIRARSSTEKLSPIDKEMDAQIMSAHLYSSPHWPNITPTIELSVHFIAYVTKMLIETGRL